MIKKIALLFIALALNVSSIFASPIQYPISSYLKRTYLEMIKIKEIAPKEILHIVLGNQSGDMDSIASAIAFSYANRSRGFYIPVINIPKEDLALRGDVLHVFKTLHIDPNFLFYKEDLNFLLSLAKQGYLRVTLVDHNRLSPDQESFKDYIEKIIDHHKEENNFYPLMKEEDKMILKIGSNSTLIAKPLSSSCDLSSQEAYLLLSAILLDTANLKNTNITTEEDTTTARSLKKIAGQYYNETLFDDLLKYRNAVEHLTPDLLLKKDYKIYKEGNFLYGIASISKKVQWTPENRLNWKESLKYSLEKDQVHLLSVFAYDGNDRVFIVYIPDLQLQKAVLSHIEQTPTLNALLKPNGYFPEDNLFFFKLQNPLSRKQLQPLLSFETNFPIQNALH